MDTGTAAFAVVEGVTVTATINETLSFSLATVSGANCDTVFGDMQDATATATTIAFGTIAAINTFYHGCNNLTVGTNGSSGFAVTGQENDSLYDSSITTASTTIYDSSGDSGSMSETASSIWGTASNNGFGYACYDSTGDVCVLNTTSQYRAFACTGADGVCNPGTGGKSPETVLSSSTATSTVSWIEYKLSVSPVQAAGNYTNTITYIATPTY